MVVTVGLCTGVALDPMNVPPQEPVNHLHDATEPRLPPFIPSVEDEPEAIVAGFAVADVAGVEEVLIVKVTLTQVVVFNVPCALT